MHVRESHTKEFNLSTLLAPELETLGLGAAATVPPDYELLTDVWLEFKRRGRDERAAAYARQLAKLGLAPVEWLPLARQVAAGFRRRRAGKHHVYVVLLDGFAKRGERFGVYVGESSRTPENRLRKHLDGGDVAAQCHRKMRGLLHSLFTHLNPLHPDEARELEVALVLAFESVGLRVKGPRKLKARNCDPTYSAQPQSGQVALAP